MNFVGLKRKLYLILTPYSNFLCVREKRLLRVHGNREGGGHGEGAVAIAPITVSFFDLI